MTQENRVKSRYRSFKTLALVALLTATALAIQCEFKTEAELFVSDILALAKDPAKTPPLVNVVIKFEVSAKKTCEEKQAEFAALLAEYYRNLKVVKCGEIGMKSYLFLKAQIPLVKISDDSIQPQDTLLHLTLQDADGTRKIGAYLNRELYDRLNKASTEKYYQGLDKGSFSIEIKVSNDTAETQELTAFSAFVDDKPVPLSETFELPPRGAVSVQVSKIMTAYLHERRHHEILQLKTAAPKMIDEKKSNEKKIDVKKSDA